MNSIALDPKSQAMMALFSKDNVTDANRQSLLDDPLAALASIGIEVDAARREAVAQGLRAVVLSHAPAAPAGLLKAKRGSNEFEQYIHVSAELWGMVVRIDHEAIKQLPRGMKAIEPLAEGIGAVMSVSSALGPAAVVIFGGLAFWSAVLTAYVLVLPEIDRGKGVYLTITWPQMAAVVASGGLLGFAMLPIPTAVL
ncbi:MAG: hypothetical protein AB7I35_02190 [Ramlibacter sp.]